MEAAPGAAFRQFFALGKVTRSPPIETNPMKKILFALFFLCATVAFGQTASVRDNNPQPTEFTDHVQHASLHAMGQESSLLGGSAYSYEHGERPLWEFETVKTVTPLGDTARALRKEHAMDKKAAKVWEN